MGDNSLMWAADAGCAKGVRLLISKGADVQATDKAGNTAIRFLDSEKHNDILVILKRAKAGN